MLMMAARTNKILSLFKQCLKEVKIMEEMKNGPKEYYVWQKSPIYNCVKSNFYSNTGDLTMLSTYITLLHGSNNAQKLISIYKGVGERSIEETAHIVGLKLPKLYEDKS